MLYRCSEPASINILLNSIKKKTFVFQKLHGDVKVKAKLFVYVMYNILYTYSYCQCPRELVTMFSVGQHGYIYMYIILKVFLYPKVWLEI